MEIQFFHRKLPVKGEAVRVPFEDGDYKFWTVCKANGERCITVREMVGVVSLQERIDTFIREEASKVPNAGYAMIWAHHIRPAVAEEAVSWAAAHPKQMKDFLL